MTHVFNRHCHATPPTAVAGDGCYIIDSTGKRYFDGSGGAAVSCLGHSNASVTEAIKAQVDKLAFAHTGFLTSEPAEALADLLIEHAPGDPSALAGGAEALLARALERHPAAAERLGEIATPAGARALDRCRPERVAADGAFLAGDPATRKRQDAGNVYPRDYRRLFEVELDGVASNNDDGVTFRR